MHMPIVVHIKPEVNAFVNGKSRHQAMLMVNMGTYGTYPVRGENVIFIVCHVAKIQTKNENYK
jgi:hypothetical protein